MKITKYTGLTLSLFLVITFAANLACADVRLPKILGSHMVLQREKPINIWGWADKGEQVTVTFQGKTATAKANDAGKWAVQLPAQKANAKPADLVVKGKNEIKLTDILVGEVWLCSGQSNMEWPMSRTQFKGEEIPKANHAGIRLYKINKKGSKTPLDDLPHDWTACTPKLATQFTGVGYHFGKTLYKELKVPIGLIQSAWGGTQIEPWTPAIGMKQVPSLKAKAANGHIYNAMIHPLAPFTFRGIIWYQGESNCLKGDTTIYTDRTLAMVAGWRQLFKQNDLSFYFVQIAPFTYVKAFQKRNKNITVESLPRFWDAQAACMTKIPDCGMVVVTDITGNVKDIHPGNKRDVGSRLANWALAKNYGKKNRVYSGPMYKSMTTAGNAITLTFDHLGGGLKSLDGKPLSQFRIAGKDKKFVAATAKIKGSTIIVTSPEVSQPVAVRFAWHETAIGNLGNKAGLPAVQFRTDNFPPVPPKPTPQIAVKMPAGSIINGKDLTGWKDKHGGPYDGQTKSKDGRYTAKDGKIIVNPGKGLNQLWTTKSFAGDFKLTLEFRASINADSGLFLRKPQLQVRDYLVAGPYKNLKKYKPQDWNKIVVIVKNNIAHCTCNGEILNAKMRLPATGPIGLEADRGTMEYRNIILTPTK